MLESLKEWKGALIVIGILLLLTPIFALAADLVGYAEPLENVAEELGAMEHENPIISGILPDYTIPGANPYVSAIVAGIVGCVIVLVIGILVGKALAR